MTKKAGIIQLNMEGLAELRQEELIKLYEVIIAGHVQLIPVTSGQLIEYKPVIIGGTAWIPVWKIPK